MALWQKIIQYSVKLLKTHGKNYDKILKTIEMFKNMMKYGYIQS